MKSRRLFVALSLGTTLAVAASSFVSITRLGLLIAADAMRVNPAWKPSDNIAIDKQARLSTVILLALLLLEWLLFWLLARRTIPRANGWQAAVIAAVACGACLIAGSVAVFTLLEIWPFFIIERKMGELILKLTR